MKVKIFVDRKRKPDELTTFGAVVFGFGSWALVFLAALTAVLRPGVSWIAVLGISLVVYSASLVFSVTLSWLESSLRGWSQRKNAESLGLRLHNR